MWVLTWVFPPTFIYYSPFILHISEKSRLVMFFHDMSYIDSSCSYYTCKLILIWHHDFWLGDYQTDIRVIHVICIVFDSLYLYDIIFLFTCSTVIFFFYLYYLHVEWHFVPILGSVFLWFCVLLLAEGLLVSYIYYTGEWLSATKGWVGGSNLSCFIIFMSYYDYIIFLADFLYHLHSMHPL